MARFRLVLVLLILSVLVCRAALPLRGRTVTPLNDGWEMTVTPAALAAGLAKAVPARAVVLPHAWGAVLADAQAVEYARPLVLPDAIGPAGVLLVIENAVGSLEVRVDGVRAAGFTGNGLTRAVRLTGEAGSQHRLTLRLSRDGLPDALRAQCGLGPVRLEVLPAARFEALLPETNAARGTVSVTYRIAAEEPGPALLRLRLFPPDLTTTRALTERHFTVQLPRGVLEGTYTFSIRKFQPWSPDAPKVYRVRATLQRGRAVQDSWETACGGSTLQLAAGLRLNDAPLVLKGLRLPGGVPPPGDLEDELVLVKKAGFNAIMAEGAALPEEALALADTLGLLVVGEIPPDGDGRPDITAAVEAQGSHPCLAAWSWADAGGTMRDMPALRAIDHTRPVLVRSGAKSQFFNPPPILLGRVFSAVEMTALDDAAGRAALAAAETGTTPLLACALGGGEDEDGYQDRLRDVVETVRRAGVPIGYFVRPLHGDTFAGLGTTDGTPTDAFTSASLYNQPCAIALRVKSAAGGLLSLDAAVINDLSLAGSLRLYVIVTTPDGKTSLTNSALTLNEQRIQPLALAPISATQTGDYRIHLVLVRNTALLASSQAVYTVVK
jgi:hypothetical protein